MLGCCQTPPHPPPAPQAFKAFNCVDLDAQDGVPGPAVMAADLGVVCWDEARTPTAEYVRIKGLAIVGLLTYPLLVPLAYATLFWNVRHAIWSDTPTELSRAVRFLTEEYPCIG